MCACNYLLLAIIIVYPLCMCVCVCVCKSLALVCVFLCVHVCVFSLSGGGIAELCSRNASAAAEMDRPDLVRAWSIAALVADSKFPVLSDPNSGVPWSQHPFSRQLIYSL